MKKLLTILVLALVLCMLSSVAMAATEYPGTYGSATEDGTNAFMEAVDASRDDSENAKFLQGIRVWSWDNLADAKKAAKHGEPSLIHVTGAQMSKYWQWQEDAEGDHYIEDFANYDPADGSPLDDWNFATPYDSENDELPEGATRVSWKFYEWTVDKYDVGVDVWIYLNVHDKNGTKKEIKATCTEKGYTYYTCSKCGYVWDGKDEEASKTDATGHNFSWKVTKEATCTEKGSRIMTCVDCGVTTGKAEAIDELGHDWGWDWDNIIFMPSCSSNVQTPGSGKTYSVCYRCGAKDTTKDGQRGFSVWDYQNHLANDEGMSWEAAREAFDGHQWDAWKDEKAATCTTYASKVRWCKVCNLYEHEYDYEAGRLDPVYAPVEAVPCTIKAGDEIEFQCVLCEGSWMHENITVTVTEDDIATLDEKGTVVIKDEDGLCATVVSHTPKKTDKSEYFYNPTTKDSPADKKQRCGDETWAKFTCSVCKKDLPDAKVADARVHKLGEWTETTPAEGTETARWMRKCTYDNCSFVEVKASATKPEVCESGKHTYVLAHPAEYDWLGCGDSVEDAQLVCSVCGDTTTGKYTAPKHDYKQIAVITEATCTKAGEEVVKCSRCGDIITRAVAAFAHKDKDGKLTLKEVAEVKATCKAAGTKAAYECTQCGQLFEDKDATKAIDALVVIPVDETAHVWDKGVVTTEATTEKEGVKTYTCSVCGKTKTEAIAKLVPPTEFTSEFKFDTDTMTLSGKATQKEGTAEAGKVFARVTYFLADGTFIAVSVPVEEDGTFESMCTSDLAHVSVRIVDSAKVRPGEYNYLDK